MKKGYHSTQRKYFNTGPRSAFLGLALGYAVGLFLAGFFRMNNQVLQIVGVVIGVGVGYWIDRKYFMEEDVPVEEIEAQLKQEEEAEAAEAEEDDIPEEDFDEDEPLDEDEDI